MTNIVPKSRMVREREANAQHVANRRRMCISLLELARCRTCGDQYDPARVPLVRVGCAYCENRHWVLQSFKDEEVRGRR